MSHNVGVFVDVSNLFYSAKSAGVEVNYCRLLEHSVAGRDLIRASAYTGVDPENPNQRKFIDFLRANGYKVICKDIHKYEGGRIKANLDIEMAVDIMLLSENLDVVVLVSGDGDFVRLIDAVQTKGVRCEVIGFGISTSNELIDVADQFTEIGSLPGIFRNAPSGPGVHIKSVQGAGADSRSVYAYSAYSISTNTGYGVQPERVSGERERERLRAGGERPQPYWDQREGRQQQLEGHGGYDYATHDEFSLPDADACADVHSIPLPRPHHGQLPNGNGSGRRE
ncbi:MAG TPA: NYN domain-containing protein [Chloroflexia bacterium]